jgi:hypothetical protein
MDKFCVNCKHCKASEVDPNNGEFFRCLASGKVNLVNGEREIKFCQTMRSSIEDCGPDGKLYEPARTPDFRDGRNPRYDDDWGDGRTDTAPDGRLLKDVHK